MLTTLLSILETLMSKATANTDFKVVVTPDLIERSVTLLDTWGRHVENPCTICEHLAAAHLLIRGEAICRECETSCSKRQGAATAAFRRVG